MASLMTSQQVIHNSGTIGRKIKTACSDLHSPARSLVSDENENYVDVGKWNSGLLESAGLSEKSQAIYNCCFILISFILKLDDLTRIGSQIIFKLCSKVETNKL